LTEAVRIVTRMTRELLVSAGGVYSLGYHVGWSLTYRRPVLAARVAGRCKELIRAYARQRPGVIVALEIMSDPMHLSMKAHPSDSPSPVNGQFEGFT
jgi:REP element-mobilizing transposase RayT